VENAIKQIQQKYGLKVDGLVGPLIKMVLFNEKKQKAVPYLKGLKTSRTRLPGSGK
jgi:peptidoglycan hydrolase-like protein with peptidoglycan-binding domain